MQGSSQLLPNLILCFLSGETLPKSKLLATSYFHAAHSTRHPAASEDSHEQQSQLPHTAGNSKGAEGREGESDERKEREGESESGAPEEEEEEEDESLLEQNMGETEEGRVGQLLRSTIQELEDSLEVFVKF